MVSCLAAVTRCTSVDGVVHGRVAPFVDDGCADREGAVLLSLSAPVGQQSLQHGRVGFECGPVDGCVAVQVLSVDVHSVRFQQDSHHLTAVLEVVRCHHQRGVAVLLLGQIRVAAALQQQADAAGVADVGRRVNGQEACGRLLVEVEARVQQQLQHGRVVVLEGDGDLQRADRVRRVVLEREHAEAGMVSVPAVQQLPDARHVAAVAFLHRTVQHFLKQISLAASATTLAAEMSWDRSLALVQS